MSLDDIFQEIRTFCSEKADPAIIKKYSHYFVEGYDAYGVPGPAMEEIHRALLTKYRADLGIEGFLDLGDRLVRTGKYEEATLALMFAVDFMKEFTPLHLDRFGCWLDDGIRNWAHADMMAGSIIPVFHQKKIVPYTSLAPWRTAESKWKRRVVPVSLIKELKICPTINEWLVFLEPMMLMPEKVVHQGLGWFLREAWKLYPLPVEEYLLTWKDSAPRLIFQYATEKMTPDEKKRFKKEKNK
jgi:3-methyladenine DNA glycosylase AlkD